MTFFRSFSSSLSTGNSFITVYRQGQVGLNGTAWTAAANFGTAIIGQPVGHIELAGALASSDHI